ncbi:permease prefix domain 1-containing protein [Sinomonas sp. ASV322]|uniref:permease prefix domain 1-containing protein n=1 Tax=Sinomonas sp. ASV322 TaxID=3041920 RepID=UPI0027DB3B95|nr:permease prefix domain 1-containing protein [Sinomonas sp. ASV322]MDQ4501253.1 permease prefix domain 1-containing protein [Sinomonas sp. ASV322]
MSGAPEQREPEGPIDAYLDELLTTARDAEPSSLRRLLAETEAHLRECAGRLRAQGLSPEEAEREAVRRFGPVSTVARALRPPLSALGRLPLSAFVRPAVGLAAVGAIAVGLSGAISELFGRWWGAGFVSGDLPGVAYTAARCAVLQTPYPGLDCAQAAAEHHWGEVVEYRVALGVLGLVLLVVWRFLPREALLPGGLVPALAAAAFLLGAAATGFQALNAAVQGWQGAGAWLSAVVVALPLAVVFGIAALRGLRVRPPVSP